jgi:uncharacterized membrane protein
MAKKNAAILLIVLGVLIVLVALSFGVYQVKISEVIAVFLPEELAGFKLGKRIFGPWVSYPGCTGRNSS